MATVRIYKVAELLNTSSQEVIALLKRDHGIDVKSASSTIEEVVARQFVERLARQRNITVPSSASFADTPTAVRGRKPAPRAAEPQRPAAPALPPPRLVKTAKPVAPPPDAEALDAAASVDAPEPIEVAEAPAPEPILEVPELLAVAEPVVETEPPVVEPPAVVEEPVVPAVAARSQEPVVETPAEPVAAPPREASPVHP